MLRGTRSQCKTVLYHAIMVIASVQISSLLQSAHYIAVIMGHLVNGWSAAFDSNSFLHFSVLANLIQVLSYLTLFIVVENIKGGFQCLCISPFSSNTSKAFTNILLGDVALVSIV